MNLDIRTIALTQEEAALLKMLLREYLPYEIAGFINDESTTSEEKCLSLLKTTVAFHHLSNMLAWQPSDQIRAFRQVNTAGILALRQLILGVNEEKLEPYLRAGYEALAPAVLQQLQRALDTGQEKPVMPVSLATPPAARA